MHREHRRYGRGLHFRRPFPNRTELLERLEAYQRDLEQELADLDDLIRHLRDTPGGLHVRAAGSGLDDWRRRSPIASASQRSPLGRARRCLQRVVGERTERLGEHPASAASPGRVVDRERRPEDIACVRVEHLPRDRYVARGIADAETAPVDDGAEFALRGQQVTGVEVSVDPDRHLCHSGAHRAASHTAVAASTSIVEPSAAIEARVSRPGWRAARPGMRCARSAAARRRHRSAAARRRTARGRSQSLTGSPDRPT